MAELIAFKPSPASVFSPFSFKLLFFEYTNKYYYATTKQLAGNEMTYLTIIVTVYVSSPINSDSFNHFV